MQLRKPDWLSRQNAFSCCAKAACGAPISAPATRADDRINRRMGHSCADPPPSAQRSLPPIVPLMDRSVVARSARAPNVRDARVLRSVRGAVSRGTRMSSRGTRLFTGDYRVYVQDSALRRSAKRPRRQSLASLRGFTPRHAVPPRAHAGCELVVAFDHVHRLAQPGRGGLDADVARLDAF